MPLIAERKPLGGCGAAGLARRQLKIKEKPLISSNKTPPGTRREGRGGGKTGEQGQRRTKPKTGLGEKEGQNVQKLKGGGGGWGGGTTPQERKGSERAGPIKRSHGCNCSTYSQQILIYGRAIKACTKSLRCTSTSYNYIHRASAKRPRFSVQH